MKLALHIVRKDFLRLRGWLGLWGLVLVAKVGLGWLVRSGAGMSANFGWVAQSGTMIGTDLEFQRLSQLLSGLSWLQGAMTFLLALRVVQEDALVGAQQFWITRPISGGRLLAAKFLGAALMLVGVPVLIALPWWLTCSFGTRELTWAITETAVLQLLIVLPAVAVASLTDSLQRALLWTMVLVAAAATASIWWKPLIFAPNQENLELAWARTVLPLVTLASTAVLVIALQFFSQRQARSFAFFGIGIALAVGIAGGWPAVWTFAPSAREVNVERAAGVGITFSDANFNPPPGVTSLPDQDMYIHMTARGVPEDRLLMSPDPASHIWRWQNGPTLVRKGWMESSYHRSNYYAVRAVLGLHEPVVDAETERELDLQYRKYRDAMEASRVQAGLPPVRWAETRPKPLPKSDAVRLETEVMVPVSFAKRVHAEPPSYEARLALQLWRPEVWFEFPLKTKEWRNHGAHAMRVEIAQRPNRQENPFERVGVTFVETSPATWRDWLDVSFSQTHRERDFHAQMGGSVYLANHSLGWLEEIDRERTLRLRVCGVQVVWHSLLMSVPTVSRAGQWVDSQPDWLDHTTLAMISYHEEARFVRELKMEHFEFNK